ncbi:MAG: glutamate--cysteine ligase [Planctomycetes bacterium]|nr:glutamate--cysteine ligase [Planctomycetota bacterium]
MVVDRETFAVRPIADHLLHRFAGAFVGDYEDGPIAWSNELALHVLELKTNGVVALPGDALAGFRGSLARIDAALEGLGARLMPGGMHPTMDPAREFVRWPHDYGEVYAAYDRIFDCRGHGWSNLQSCHLNLPFADDAEFGRLHLAVRTLLPLLPALAASSPYRDGAFHGWLDGRLAVYRDNQRRVPRIAGLVVPEPVTTRADYFATILEPIWNDIAPFDPDRLLREEWLNSRGAVAKFFRDAVEIRVLDVQEQPAADLAICTLVVAVLRALCVERWASMASLQALDTRELAEVLWAVAKDGDEAVVAHPGLLRALGRGESALRVGSLWASLADAVLPDEAPLAAELQSALATIFARGPLARRIVVACGERPDARSLAWLGRELADCLRAGTAFSP